MQLLNQLNDHLKDIPIDWQLCGGFAIDLFLGEKTRKHKDIDITVSYSDMEKCVEYLSKNGWRIVAPVGGGRFLSIKEAISNEDVFFDNIWCFREGANFIQVIDKEDKYEYLKMIEREQTELDFIEVLFNKVQSGNIYYSKNPNIYRKIESAFLKIDNFNILAPEIILLYKSRNMNNMDYKQDFELVFSELHEESKTWLRTAMSVEYPNGHPWI